MANETPMATFSRVRYKESYGTLRLTTSRFLLFEEEKSGGKKLKLSLTRIAKHQKSAANPKLRIVSVDGRTKIFELETREQLVELDKELAAALQKVGASNKNTQSKGTQQNPAGAAASTDKKPTNAKDHRDEPKKRTMIASKTKHNSDEPKRRTMTAAKVETAQEPPQVTSADPEQQTAMEAAPPQSSQQPYPHCVTMAGRYAWTWGYGLICMILAIAGVVAVSNFRKSCFVMQIQLQNLKTGEPIEGTRRGYGVTAREIEPGEVPDYHICREYTAVELEYAFGDKPFKEANQASQDALTSGVMVILTLCFRALLVFLGVVRIVPWATGTLSLVVAFCILALDSLGKAFDIFQTDFCQTHLCNAGPGAATGVFAFLMWGLLLLLLLLRALYLGVLFNCY